MTGSTESSADFFLLKAAAVTNGSLLIEIHRKDGSPRYADTLNLLRHSCSLSEAPNPPTLVAALIRTAVIYSISASLYSIPTEHLNDATLSQMDEALGTLNYRADFLENLQSEGLFLVKIFPIYLAEPELGDLQWVPTGLRDLWCARLIELNNSKIKLLQGADQLGYLEYKAMQNLQLKENRGPFADLKNQIDGMASLTDEQIPKIVNIPNAFRTTIAIRRFELANKTWPKNLDELVPQFLPKVPEDITTGKPFPYSLNSDGLPKLSFALHNRTEIWEMISPAERDRRFEAR